MVGIKDDYYKALYKDFNVSTKNKVKLIKRDELKEGEKLSIVSNTMFKAMFFNEKRLKYSAKLFSYLLDVDYDILIKNMRLSKNELDKDREINRELRCDFVAEIDNTYLNLEMNNNASEDTMRRNRDYTFKLYSSSDILNNKRYNYKQVISINLNNFKFEGLDESFYIETIGNKYYRATNDIIIFQIFIPNIINKCYNKEKLDNLESFIMALIEKDVDIAKKYALGDEIVKDYIKEATTTSFDNRFGESYDHEYADREQSYNDGYDAGIEKGIEEGMETGSRKSKIEIAKSLLKNNIDINIIIDSTGITKEELNKLQ